MQLLVSLPHLGRSAPSKVGEFRYSHVFKRHLYKGVPLDCDLANPASVAAANKALDASCKCASLVYGVLALVELVPEPAAALPTRGEAPAVPVAEEREQPTPRPKRSKTLSEVLVTG